MREITIAGNVGKDVEVQYGKTSGMAYATMNVAVSRKVKDKFESDWYTVRVFGEMAEACGEIKKGERVIVSGRLQLSEWTDKTGAKRLSVELMADEVGRSIRVKKSEGSNFDSFGEPKTHEEIQF